VCSPQQWSWKRKHGAFIEKPEISLRRPAYAKLLSELADAEEDHQDTLIDLTKEWKKPHDPKFNSFDSIKALSRIL
jgi:hypothetical protein